VDKFFILILCLFYIEKGQWFTIVEDFGNISLRGGSKYGDLC